MGMTLPAELERVLNDLGFTWPEVDEMDLFGAGATWLQFAGTVDVARAGAQGATDQLAAINTGEAMEAFLAKWENDDAPSKVLSDANLGLQVGGAAILLCAAVVLTLKIITIINLIILLIQIIQAIAAAVATFGASLAWIPIAKGIAQRIIGALVNEATMAVLG